MPSILRSAVAVVAGFLAMTVVVIVLTLIAVKTLHLQSEHPTTGYLALNLIYSLAAAVLGGWITARIARPHSLRTGYALALVLFLFGLYSYRFYSGSQPVWYQAVLVILPPLCAILGAGLASAQPTRSPTV